MKPCIYQGNFVIDEPPSKFCVNRHNVMFQQRVNEDICQHCQQNIPDPHSSRLVNLETTLPPHKEGRDRKLTFEPDGCIYYEHSNDETPPRDINGYKRDPNDPFRFIPLWPDCSLRHERGVRYADCGCIDVIMHCNNPDAIQFGDHINHEQCCVCQWRRI